jgi:hypothetical protein
MTPLALLCFVAIAQYTEAAAVVGTYVDTKGKERERKEERKRGRAIHLFFPLHLLLPLPFFA